MVLARDGLTSELHNTLLWRHNGRDSVSNHQPHHYLINRLFKRRSKKASKLRVTGLCAGNSSVTGELRAQMASNAAIVSIWWRHHDCSSERVSTVRELQQWWHNVSYPRWRHAWEITSHTSQLNVMVHPSLNTLRLTEIDAVLQTTFSNAFSLSEKLCILIKFHWNLFPSS